MSNIYDELVMGPQPEVRLHIEYPEGYFRQSPENDPNGVATVTIPIPKYGRPVDGKPAFTALQIDVACNMGTASGNVIAHTLEYLFLNRDLLRKVLEALQSSKVETNPTRRTIQIST